MADFFDIQIPLAKTDASKRLVFGYANVARAADGSIVTDLHGDQIDPSSLEDAAYDFVLYYREGGLEHQVMGVARLVESVFITPEKLQAMGIVAPTYKGAAWFVGFKVLDEALWKSVQAGEITCFSIGGTAMRQES